MGDQLSSLMQIKLPSVRWHRVLPEQFGATGVALMAVRESQPGEYVPTLVVEGGLRGDDLTLEEIADESISALQEEFDSVGLVKRREGGSGRLPAMLQLVEIETEEGGRRFDLQQAQVFQEIPDIERPGNRLVLSYTMTDTFKESQRLKEEFSDFFESLNVSYDSSDEESRGGSRS